MSNTFGRWLLVVAGTICVIVGAIGIVVPILPTTPFLLLAALCYTRGSTRLYGALLSNRILGSYIRNYLEGRGMTLKAKVWTLSLLWTGIVLASALATDSLLVRILLAGVLVGVTIHILMVGTAKTKSEATGDPHPS